MLGEAATTAEDAAGYLEEYEHAVHVIGKASHRRGIYEGPGISIKLSALHPRYQRIKRARALNELLPRATKLAALAKSYDIGFNIDAEEADRLDLSLDILEALCFDPDLGGWNGLGFVIQAYGKRCAFVDRLADRPRPPLASPADGPPRQGRLLGLARSNGRRSTDSTTFRSSHARSTPTSAISPAPANCSPRPTRSFPQFATHNAQTLASVLVFAGPDFYRGQYEFQCLHGMGEPLYEEVVGRHKLDRPCRVYAPVGSHETLLAYLVRRLLENGANTSFVNRIADAGVAVDELVADPVARPRDPAARRAAREDRRAARPLCARSLEFARRRFLRRAASGRARQGARRKREDGVARRSAGRGEGRPRRAGPEPRRSARHRRLRPLRARRRDRQRARRRRPRRARSAPRSRPPSGRRSCAAPPTSSRGERPARRPHRARGRQVLRQCGRRSARGGRLPALLRA